MATLLPRLPRPVAARLLEEFISSRPREKIGYRGNDLPDAVRYAATGGSRAHKSQLVKLRDGLLKIGQANGFPSADRRNSFAKFDAEVTAFLIDNPLFGSGEALRDDVWAFIGVSLAPELVYWRFGSARERYLGGVRNTFQRLWLRGRVLDRGANHPKRWQLVEDLTEDALVQITERPSLGGDPVLASAIAETWLRAGRHFGKHAMEPIMRRAILRIRIWNEVRSLAELPVKDLEKVLADAFNLPVIGKQNEETPVVGRNEFTATKESRDRRVSAEDQESAHGGVANAAADASENPRTMSGVIGRILTEAKRRRWISPKSMAAMQALDAGKRDLSTNDRNSLEYLFRRMRAAGILLEEVAQISQAISAQEASEDRVTVSSHPPSSVRKSSKAIVRAR